MTMTRASFCGALVCALVLASCASAPEVPPGPPPPPVQRSEGAWLFNFDAPSGIASAVLRSSQGALLVELNCEGPSGPLVVRDWTFTELAAGPQNASVRLGQNVVAVTAASPASPAGRAGLSFALDPRAPAVSQLFQGQEVQVLTTTKVHVWAEGAAGEIVAVANACVQRGS
jgi:hypothetical protein